MVEQRKTETKDLIKQAFTKLLKEKGFNTLTVSDITRKAGINRGTFYLHYIDKFDLIEKLENDCIEQLYKILLREDTESKDNSLFPYTSVLEVLCFMKENFEFIYNLAGEGGDPAFNEKVKAVMKELLNNKAKQLKIEKFTMKEIPDEYVYDIMIGIPITIIFLWIKRGGIEPPEVIARMICNTKEYKPSELLN